MPIPPFIYYHKIDVPTPDVKIRGAFTTPKRFRKQMAYLRKLGIASYTASEMIERFLNDGRFPERAISITFDDGWKDNYTNAFPILKEYGVKATIFLVPGCVGQTTDTVTADGEGPREHLSKDNIREMAAAGIEMGSHGYNHLHFDKLLPAEAEKEIVLSKSFVEALVQKECRVLAYPAGFFNETARETARRAGYAAAFTTEYGRRDEIDLYSINRTEILRRDRLPFKFSRKIASIVSV
jgi:peptidoglycan/xylan/chitin deacetylase (PgdA/CDA1 family)